MAKLSAYNRQNLQYELLFAKVAVCSDGSILRSTGNGWSTWRKLKDKSQWREHHSKQVIQQKVILVEKPAYAALHEALMPFKLADRLLIRLYLKLDNHDDAKAHKDITAYQHGPISRITVEDVAEFRRLMAAAIEEGRETPAKAA